MGLHYSMVDTQNRVKVSLLMTYIRVDVCVVVEIISDRHRCVCPPFLVSFHHIDTTVVKQIWALVPRRHSEKYSLALSLVDTQCACLISCRHHGCNVERRSGSAGVRDAVKHVTSSGLSLVGQLQFFLY